MACKCGRETYFTRTYEGTELCRKCFVQSIEKKVKRVIRTNNLLSRGDKVGVALSGGKDSSSALYILAEIVKKRRDMEIFAVSIDEGIGEYRLKTIRKSSILCKKLGVPHYVYSFEEEYGGPLPELMKHNPELNACTFCGVLRRGLLNRKARELGATKLAYGFNLNDEAESVFMNFVFGNLDKFIRLGPIVKNKKIEKFVPRLKPLREIPEEELFLYCDALKIPYYGKKRCPYGKESVRKTIRKYLYDLEKKYPGTLFQIVKFADIIIPPLREKFQKTGKAAECESCGEITSKEICKVCELLEKVPHKKRKEAKKPE
ncbi:MAG: TIGR00269 family protein [Candidatus Aenigmarchaeota archaeon]|nr:TIGR00269 family protein [Candidatus Aenigmarchaeota archaeon]